MAGRTRRRSKPTTAHMVICIPSRRYQVIAVRSLARTARVSWRRGATDALPKKATLSRQTTISSTGMGARPLTTTLFLAMCGFSSGFTPYTWGARLSQFGTREKFLYVCNTDYPCDSHKWMIMSGLDTDNVAACSRWAPPPTRPKGSSSGPWAVRRRERDHQRNVATPTS